MAENTTQRQVILDFDLLAHARIGRAAANRLIDKKTASSFL